MGQTLLSHLILHNLIQEWLNQRGFSLKRFIGQKRDYLKERILALKIAGLDVDRNGVQLLPLAYRKVIKIFDKYPKKKIVIHNSDLLASSLGEDKAHVKFLRPLFQLRDYLQKHFSKEEVFDFYVHGSLSTMDYVEGYSDLDTLVIVRKEVIEDPKWLIEFKRRLARSRTFLYLVDPLQHHGHFVITEYDMKAYPEPFFPLELFKFTTRLTDFSNNLTFYVREATAELGYIFKFWIEYFSNPYKYGFRKNDAFSIKQFIQSVLLMPTIYYQFKTGKYLYKKYALKLAKSDFDVKTWSIVEKASKVRQNCLFKSYYPYWLRKIVGLYCHPALLHLIHRKFDRNNAQRMLTIMGPNMLNDALGLIKQMLEKINDDRG